MGKESSEFESIIRKRSLEQDCALKRAAMDDQRYDFAQKQNRGEPLTLDDLFLYLKATSEYQISFRTLDEISLYKYPTLLEDCVAKRVSKTFIEYTELTINALKNRATFGAKASTEITQERLFGSSLSPANLLGKVFLDIRDEKAYESSWIQFEISGLSDLLALAREELKAKINS